MKWWGYLIIAAIVVVALGTLTGAWGASLLGAIIGLFPAGKKLMERARAEGAQQQARTDRAKADAERAELRAQWVEIDKKTASELEAIQRRAEERAREYAAQRGRPPTPEEEAELLAKFGARPPR